MPDSILGREANPGLLLHEWTKNFRGGQVYEFAPPAPDAGPAGAWAERLFPPGSESEDFAATEEDAAVDRRTCLETFARRGSIRQYADAPLGRDHLAQFLSLCYPHVARESRSRAASTLNSGLQRGLGPITSCKLFPLVVNVSGLASGAYIYDERGPSLHALNLESPLPVIKENSFQAEFTHAPVLVLMVGSLAEGLARYGDRGYRSMLLEAGLMIQRLYLAAAYLGLAGCVTGSLIQPRFNEWLGMDGFHSTVLLAFAVGQPVAATETEHE
ncbi:MAG: hypothetical protein QOC99_1639 [Acidobacteriota bacterium]|jgi:SagB-type dehydrogenase family enzyme|nr:hypothetical protein [Acidobacteriota bacterium]